MSQMKNRYYVKVLLTDGENELGSYLVWAGDEEQEAVDTFNQCIGKNVIAVTEGEE